MSTLFSKAEPPTETHPAFNKNGADADGQSQQNDRSPKPSSEKESTLFSQSIRDSTAPDDTNKETTPIDSSMPSIPNNDSNKESLPRQDSEKEASSPTDSSEKDSEKDNSPEQEIEYPSPFRLILITIALCLCVFCVALVSANWLWEKYLHIRLTLPARTIPSSRQPFRKSRTNSTHLVMWVGMVVRIC